MSWVFLYEGPANQFGIDGRFQSCVFNVAHEVSLFYRSQIAPLKSFNSVTSADVFLLSTVSASVSAVPVLFVCSSILYK